MHANKAFLLLVLLAGCHSDGASPLDSFWPDALLSDQSAGEARGRADGGLYQRVDADCPLPTPQTVDCTDGNPDCQDVMIQGDPIAAPPGFFRGYSDPTVRQDPQTKRIWMAYSYPRMVDVPDGNGGTVEAHVASIHLAHSDDLGGSWTFDKDLWPAVVVSDPENASKTGVMASEVASLMPASTPGGVVWYAVRLTYFLEPLSGYHPRAKSFQMRVTRASSPGELGSAEEQSLGSSFASAAFKPDVNLNTLPPPAGAPTLQQCGFWNDPGIYFQGGRLYLAMQCTVYTTPTTPDDAATRIVVFSTDPTGQPKSWVWTYVGVLADSADAAELGDKMLNQTDLVTGTDGQLLALVTPSHTNPDGRVIHQGCRVLALDSLDPPRLRRKCGKLVVRAVITATDEPAGTGACGYDPQLISGVLQVRRPIGPNDRWSIRATGLRP